MKPFNIEIFIDHHGHDEVIESFNNNHKNVQTKMYT